MQDSAQLLQRVSAPERQIREAAIEIRRQFHLAHRGRIGHGARPMPSTHPSSFLIRATPLTFALLWSSGFIVAKYAVPDADPLTFLVARFALTILILVLIAVASAALESKW